MLFPVADEVFGEIVKRKRADEADQHHKEVVKPSFHDEAAASWKVPEHWSILP